MATWTKPGWVLIASGLCLLIPTREPARAQAPSAEPEAPGQAAAEGEAAPNSKAAPGDDAPAGNRIARADDARLLAFQRLQARIKRPSDIPQAARLEFRVHARRMARLARIRSLAEYANDRATVQRADRISERERTRHQHALARVWPALSDPKAATRSPDEAEPRVPEDEEEPEPEP
jgi:hypothetical protein